VDRRTLELSKIIILGVVTKEFVDSMYKHVWCTFVVSIESEGPYKYELNGMR